MFNISRVFSFILSVVVLVALSTAIAIPGEYHFGATLNCSDCHVSHASISHDANGLVLNAAQTASIHLVKGSSVSDMCLGCHDSQPGIPDVLGNDINNPSERYDGTERAAGQFSDEKGDNWKGHNLPGQGDISSGGCISCHDPHGNSNYRNLRALDGADEGAIAFVNPMASGLERYQRSNVGYVKNIGDKLCAQCHDLGMPEKMIAPGASGRFHRHPSSGKDMIITVTGENCNAKHWVTGEGSGFMVDGSSVPRVPFAMNTATDFTMATAVSADNEVFCLSCHKAHGSAHAFGMQWSYGNSGGLMSSSGCNQCHNVSGM